MQPWPVHRPQVETSPRLPQLVAPPTWLPGNTRVDVVGESFRQEAVEAAARQPAPDGTYVGVLVPAPPFAEYPEAVAVYVQTHHVGYLAKEIAQEAHPALLRFAQASGGSLPACPARIADSDLGLWVVLQLDPVPLGLSPSLFGSQSNIVEAMPGLLARLAQPSPLLTGHDAGARSALEAAELSCEEIEADYDRDRRAWPRLEKTARRVLDALIQAQDPWISRAWSVLAHATRYQKGRRDETLRTYVEAVYCDRYNAAAAKELIGYVSIVPTVPMLLGLLRCLPPPTRLAVLPTLLSVSYGHDRHGNLGADDGAQLRRAMAELAEVEQDNGVTAALSADAGLRAEKAGDLESAVAHYRKAVVAGCQDPKVADRYSIWLVREAEYAEAARVLRQALAVAPESRSVRERLQKRLDRCVRMGG